MTDRIGPGRGANRNTSILGAHIIFPRYIPPITLRPRYCSCPCDKYSYTGHRDYMINYARSFIYTTSISYANIIAVDSSFDLLEQEASELVSPFYYRCSSHLTSSIHKGLWVIDIFCRHTAMRITPPIPSLLSFVRHLHRASTPRSTHISFPSPIIAILTVCPKPPSLFLYPKWISGHRLLVTEHHS